MTDTDLNLLEHDTEPGTDITVVFDGPPESVAGQEHDAYAHEDGYVRAVENDAVYNDEVYSIQEVHDDDD